MLKELPPTFLTCLGLGSLRGAQTLSFDVANIHPHDRGDSRFVVHMPSNGHFAATGAVGKLVLNGRLRCPGKPNCRRPKLARF